MLKTKIICTLGPAVDNESILEKLILTGFDVARFNFSHGTHQEQLIRLNNFREICKKLGVTIPVLMDMKGPEIRLGNFSLGEAVITEGQAYTLTAEETDCNEKTACISYKCLADDVSAGSKILFDDGLICMEVTEVSDGKITLRALNGGKLSSKKSVNIPNTVLNLPAFTEQDKSDLLFAIENKFEYIAASFVRKKEDILQIEKFLKENGGENIRVISKIENREGLDNLDDIITVSDSIIVARGDLGVEIPIEEIPSAQKKIIHKCYKKSKSVITATQMLDSMIRNPRPTRAEVTDIANAIYDGTSAIMLSGETASGKYPVEALQTMRKVAENTENSIHYWKRFRNQEIHDASNTTGAIGHATCTTAMDLNASAIVAVTSSGSTARKISSLRPLCPIIAVTTNPLAASQLRLSWGVYPMLVDTIKSTDELFNIAALCAKKSGLAKPGDTIVVTAGVPIGISGTTNMLKVEKID